LDLISGFDSVPEDEFNFLSLDLLFFDGVEALE
jgi:hypothetical protein